jgi:hypothetical protein
MDDNNGRYEEVTVWNEIQREIWRIQWLSTIVKNPNTKKKNRIQEKKDLMQQGRKKSRNYKKRTKAYVKKKHKIKYLT